MIDQHALGALRATLAAHAEQRLSTADLCATWRAQEPLLAALPPRYKDVLEDLLGRLEAGSLFTEESCSFSQADLRTSLATWLDKAGRQLTG